MKVIRVVQDFLVERFKQLAIENGMSPEQIMRTIEGTGVVIDAEFQIVDHSKEDWEDA